MLVNEKKLFNMIDDHHIELRKNAYIVCHGNNMICIYINHVTISNNEMVLINQQHDDHLFTYAENAYKRQELKDFL